jgi:hypothetical protein
MIEINNPKPTIQQREAHKPQHFVIRQFSERLKHGIANAGHAPLN